MFNWNNTSPITEGPKTVTTQGHSCYILIQGVWKRHEGGGWESVGGGREKIPVQQKDSHEWPKVARLMGCDRNGKRGDNYWIPSKHQIKEVLISPQRMYIPQLYSPVLTHLVSFLNCCSVHFLMCFSWLQAEIKIPVSASITKSWTIINKSVTI